MPTHAQGQNVLPDEWQGSRWRQVEHVAGSRGRGVSHSGPSGRRPRSWHHHRRTQDSPSSGDLSQGLTRGEGGDRGERQPQAQLGGLWRGTGRQGTKGRAPSLVRSQGRASWLAPHLSFLLGKAGLQGASLPHTLWLPELALSQDLGHCVLSAEVGQICSRAPEQVLPLE